MGFTKKTWKNRIVEYINRRQITMEDGSTNLVTVARDEGTISQEGDAFNAANMNDLEDRIEKGFDEINQSLTNQLNWTKIGEVTGSSTIQLPSAFNELYIEVNTGGSSWHEIFNIPFVALTEQSKDYFNGFYSSSANSSMVQISVNKNTANMLTVIRGGNQFLNTSKMTVYYR